MKRIGGILLAFIFLFSSNLFGMQKKDKKQRFREHCRICGTRFGRDESAGPLIRGKDLFRCEKDTHNFHAQCLAVHLFNNGYGECPVCEKRLPHFDLNKVTVLSYIADVGHNEFLRFLVERGKDLNVGVIVDFKVGIRADLNYGGCRGVRPLMVLAEKGNKKMVDYVLQQGADPNVDESLRRTPLMFAAEKGHDEVVKSLIEAGANIEATDEYGATPLIYAVCGGYWSTIDLLRSYGANCLVVDSFGMNALMHAAEEGNFLVIPDLVEFGIDLDSRDKNGKTPLMHATESKRNFAVRTLLKLGANRTLRDEKGNSVEDLQEYSDMKDCFE